ncbi:MAG: 30S ribosomal protein S12 methylthiotransferase RimO [candidate division Zixibacteria bacterium]|nr:30S ribosomal protein S12 methylthiotransferase RimO [candidate division Zixibacteria bacterium]
MKFYIHKLGCPKNDVDADYICARLIDQGHVVVSSPEKAESIIVNSCCFIEPAKEESIENILSLAQLKDRGVLQALYVSGCLSQRYGDELLSAMPEIDGAFGIGELDAIAETISSSVKPDKAIRTPPGKLCYLDWTQRYIADNFPYAYLKISDGCNHGCTYCAIPGIRGRFRSRPMSSILEEARFLAMNGKKELVLVSQDATSYGRDLRDKIGLVDLLRELDRIEEVNWIRLLYLYSGQIDNELIDYMVSDNKTLSYFDLPLQHINSDILAAMGRKIDRAAIEDLLAKIRSGNSKAVLRVTFIVGFPGETKAQFEELYDFTITQRFEHMAAFMYSAEEGTRAVKMDRQVRTSTKAQRLDRLMSLQREIAFDRNVSLIDTFSDVIIDSVESDGVAFGRTQGDCPEIDQEVLVHGGNPGVGDIVRVQITDADGYDLKAVICEE